MCSYNRLNGNYACENTHLLSEVLKHDWHFNGEVQSDWGATHSTSKAINAGLDEEEGSDAGPAYFARVPVLYALANHDISEAAIDDMVRPKLYAMILTGAIDESPKATGQIDFATANTFAQDAEERSIVLLRNEGKQLPLSATKVRKIAVIGGHADVAVMTGGGSGDTMHPVTGTLAGCGGLQLGAHAGCGWWRTPLLKVDVPILKAIQDLAPGTRVAFAGCQDEKEPFRAYSKGEIESAVALAASSDVAIMVAAQPAGEDFRDLTTLALSNPSNQDELIEAVAKANPHTFVILESSNPVLMPWKEKVGAIVEAWFPGEAGGKAIANVLFGKVNPSGKLPLTFPARDQDTPTWERDGALVQDPVYSEKLNVGYRWYDATKMDPSFEFGFGLSYTHFTYSDLAVKTNADNSMSVAFSVKNDGPTAGAEVPQVYLEIKDKDEPPRRLVGWNKITLKPGETQRVLVNISPRMQSVWDTNRNEWRFVADSAVFVRASSRDIRISTK